MKKLLIILPAFNEEKVIGGVLDDLKEVLKNLKEFDPRIVVVDDASDDKTREVVRQKGIKVLCHVINRGLGGALGTGLAYARRQEADITITMDSDGQHNPKDLKKMLKPLIKKESDVVIGKRDVQKMPWDRRLMTFLSSLITFLFFGIYSHDTQSGFRAFNKKALNKIRIKTQRMEVSSEFFREIKKNSLKFTEIPIEVIYTSYSRSKGQKNLNSFEILLKLVLRFFR